MASKKKFTVVAQAHFSDALTGKTFRAGDEVTGWDEDRAKHYEGRGLVTIREGEPEEDDKQMKLEEAPTKPGPKEATPASPDAGAALEQPEAAQLEGKPDGKPGPKETKEAEDEPEPEEAKEEEPEASKAKSTRSSRSRKKK